MLWIKRISVGERSVCVASSRKCRFSTSPAVSIEESKRDPAVLARCSIDLPTLLFVPLQKLYPRCCRNSRASSFGKLWLLILFIYFCARKRGEMDTAFERLGEKNGGTAWRSTQLVARSLGWFLRRAQYTGCMLCL